MDRVHGIQGGESARAVVLHPYGRNLSQVLVTGSDWFFPTSIGSTTRQVLFAVLAAFFLAITVDLARLRVRDSGRSVRRVLGLFAVCYLATIEITRFYLDSATPIDGRLLGPLQPVLYALILGVLAAWLRARFELSYSWITAVVSGLVVVVALTSISTSLSIVRDQVRPAAEKARRPERPLPHCPPAFPLSPTTPSSCGGQQGEVRSSNPNRPTTPLVRSTVPTARSCATP